MSQPGEFSNAILQTEGQPVTALESVRDRFEPNSDRIAQLIGLLSTDEAWLQSSAAWLLRQYCADGRYEFQLSRASAAAIARTLPALTDPWARLHICQMLSCIPVPSRNAEQVARFVRACWEAPNTFLRAWAVDALYRLAGMHEKYLPEAMQLITDAAEDKAASIRARVRRLRAESDFADPM